jgi:hypothetical protein
MIGTVLLYIEHGDGAAIAHRAIPRGDVRLAVIGDRRQRAVPIQMIDERGSVQALVPAADLVAAESLTAAEEAEYQRLDAQLAGTIGETRTLKRFNSLRLRSLMFGAPR